MELVRDLPGYRDLVLGRDLCHASRSLLTLARTKSVPPNSPFASEPRTCAQSIKRPPLSFPLPPHQGRASVFPPGNVCRLEAVIHIYAVADLHRKPVGNDSLRVESNSRYKKCGIAAEPHHHHSRSNSWFVSYNVAPSKRGIDIPSCYLSNRRYELVLRLGNPWKLMNQFSRTNPKFQLTHRNKKAYASSN